MNKLITVLFLSFITLFSPLFVHQSNAVHKSVKFVLGPPKTTAGVELNSSAITSGTNFNVDVFLETGSSTGVENVYTFRLRLDFTEKQSATSNTTVDAVELLGFTKNSSMPANSSLSISPSDFSNYIILDWYPPQISLNGLVKIGTVNFRAKSPGYITLTRDSGYTLASYPESATATHNYAVNWDGDGIYTLTSPAASPTPAPGAVSCDDVSITGLTRTGDTGNGGPRYTLLNPIDIRNAPLVVNRTPSSAIINVPSSINATSPSTAPNLGITDLNGSRTVNIPPNPSTTDDYIYTFTPTVGVNTSCKTIQIVVSKVAATPTPAPTASAVSCTAVSVAGLNADRDQTTDGGPVYKISPTAFTSSNSLNRQLTATLSPGANLNIPNLTNSKIDLADSGLPPGTDAITVTTTNNGELWLNIPKKTTSGSTDNRYEFTPRASIGTSHASCKTINILVSPVLASPSPSPATTYTISGKVFKDDVEPFGTQSPPCTSTVTTNCDADWTDAAKVITVSLYKDTNPVSSTTVGGGNALYTFNNLTAGNYQIQLTSASSGFSLGNYNIKSGTTAVPNGVLSVDINNQNVVKNFGLQPLAVLACPAEVTATQVRFKANPPAANENWATTKTIKLGQQVRVTAFQTISTPGSPPRVEQTSDVDFTVFGPDGFPAQLFFPSPSPGVTLPPGAAITEIVFTPTVKGTYTINATKKARSGAACLGNSTLTVDPAGTTHYIVSENLTLVQSIKAACESNPASAACNPADSWTEFSGSPQVLSHQFQNLAVGQSRKVYALFRSTNDRVSRIYEANMTYQGANPAITNVSCTYADGRGTIITITGSNFGARETASSVRVGTKDATIEEWVSAGSASSPSPAASASPAGSASPSPAASPQGSTEYRIVARVNERLTTQTPVVVKDKYSRTVSSSCAVDLTTVSFAARTQCRPSGNLAADNVNVIIVEVAKTPTSEECDLARRPEGCSCTSNNQCISNKCQNNICTVRHEPLVNQKIRLDQQGNPQGFSPNIEKNKNYALIVKAPKTIAKKVEFLAEDGTSTFDISLPVGDIAPADLPDGVVNSFDRDKLITEWVLTTEATNRLSDFNLDNRVNSVDWSCMRQNFNKSNETVGDIVPVAPASSLIQSSPSPTSTPRPTTSPSPSPASSPSPSPSPVQSPSPNPSPS